MKEGDYFCIKESDTSFAVFKILRIDNFPEIQGGWLVYHLRIFRPVPSKPTRDDIAKLEVWVGCSPLDGKHLEEHGEVICNQPVTKEEFEPSGAISRIRISHATLQKPTKYLNRSFRRRTVFTKKDAA